MNRYPAAEWVPWKPTNPDGLPTFWRGSCKPIAVVLHVMAGWAGTARQWALEGHYGASWHFTVDQAGNVMQHLELNDAGYQAGIPATAPTPRWQLWRGHDQNVNWYTIGIEHEGFPGTAMTPEQAAASKTLCRWLKQELSIPWEAKYFPPHADIDVVNRANDFNTPALRDAHYQYLFQEDDEMTTEERELLLGLATVVAGKTTGADFTTVGEALAVIRPLVSNDDIILLGLGQQQEALGKQTSRIDDHIANHAAGVTGQDIPLHDHVGGKVVKR